jgi:hypothetical protein
VFIKNCGLTMAEKISEGRFPTPMAVAKISPQSTSELYAFLDENKRGFVHAFQLAALIEACRRNGDLGQYPVQANNGAPVHLKEFLGEQAGKMEFSVVKHFEEQGV